MIKWYLIQNNFQNALVFNTYGDRFLKKYIPNIKTFDVDRDKLFTMSNWEMETNKIFDDNLSDLDIDERRVYVTNYLYDNNPSKVFKDRYNNKINSLKSGEYFVILKIDDYFDSLADYEYFSSNKQNCPGCPKSFLVYFKLNYNALRLAVFDNRLKTIVWADKIGNWTLFIFKKI